MFPHLLASCMSDDIHCPLPDIKNSVYLEEFYKCVLANWIRVVLRLNTFYSTRHLVSKLLEGVI